MKIDSEISRKLLKWYKEHGRGLPWRTDFSPYNVWISEVMLQQTQVETVIPYFGRFLTAFPTLRTLAESDLERVLKLWEGLGYYSRARNLQKAAQIILQQFNSLFPDRFEDLIQLPGIGRSTAGAILSFAFNQRFPILDGNVKRVIIRLFAIEAPPGPAREKRLWKISDRLVPRKARDFNSALMDLGATVCRPASPSCNLCPLSTLCEGYQKNLQDKLPVRKKKEKNPVFHHVAVIVRDHRRVLIRRRPEKGLLGGLWEFPEERVKQDPLKEAGLMKGFAGKLGLQVKCQKFLFKMISSFSHFQMVLSVFTARYQSGRIGQKAPLKWVTLKEIQSYPFSAAHQKIIQRLLAESSAPSGGWVSPNGTSLKTKISG